MKFSIMLLGATLPLLAGTYKAKVEPYDSYVVSAEVPGRIVKLDPRDELKTLHKTVIEMDHALDDAQLSNNRQKLIFLREQIALKQSQYDSIKNLTSQNRFTKDKYKTELLTMKIQSEDLQSAIAALEDTIAKKTLALNGKYLKKLWVREGEYVAPGSRLMQIEDHSGARLVVYVDAHDRALLEKSHIVVDGNEGWTIEKAARSMDETFISYYRVELVKKGGMTYGKIVEVTITPKI